MGSLHDHDRANALGELSRFRRKFYTCLAALLDAVRLGPIGDATAVTAAQLRNVIERLIEAGRWQLGGLPILMVTDAGYDITRLTHVLADLPVELVGRIRSDRVLRLPKPPRLPGTNGRPPKHGPEIALDNPDTWPAAQHTTTTETTRYGPRSRPAGTGSTPA